MTHNPWHHKDNKRDSTLCLPPSPDSASPCSTRHDSGGRSGQAAGMDVRLRTASSPTWRVKVWAGEGVGREAWGGRACGQERSGVQRCVRTLCEGGLGGGNVEGRKLWEERGGGTVCPA